MNNRVRLLSSMQKGQRVETGAVQFGDDWPGLFIRGDDAHSLMMRIRQLSELTAGHPDPEVLLAISDLKRYAEMISQDIIAR